MSRILFHAEFLPQMDIIIINQLLQKEKKQTGFCRSWKREVLVSESLKKFIQVPASVCQRRDYFLRFFCLFCFCGYKKHFFFIASFCQYLTEWVKGTALSKVCVFCVLAATHHINSIFDGPGSQKGFPLDILQVSFYPCSRIY